MYTNQEKKWQSDFGIEYTKRNPKCVTEMDALHLQTKGIKRTELTKRFLHGLKIDNALEIGSNVGVALLILNALGFENLYGIEINRDAIDISKDNTKGKDIDIIKGSALEVPYKDSFFDLVFTNGLLIHISPDDINTVLDEIYRCSKRYIWGYEYYSDKYTRINYRGEDKLLWKANFAKLYLERYKDLKLVKEERYAYHDNPENVDMMYLLEKSDKGD